MLAPWKKSYDKSRQHIKKQRQHFSNKAPYSQSYGFTSSHVWVWELDHKESWAPKNWCFCDVEEWMLLCCWRKLFKSPLDFKEIKPVNLKGNQSWMFIERTDAQAEAPILWPLDAKNWLIGKDPEERLKVGGEGDNRERDGWMASPTQWTWVWASSESWWRKDREAYHAIVHGVAKSWTQLNDWTENYISWFNKCYWVMYFILSFLFPLSIML